jgi:hypothetical protein
LHCQTFSSFALLKNERRCFALVFGIQIVILPGCPVPNQINLF